jgi:recombinational DNA repair protein RecR
MAYTPELSMKSSQTLRRIAWALNKPMTTTIEEIMIGMANILNKEKICSLCRDKTICNECTFNN